MSENVKKEIFEWIKVIITALILAFVITRFIIPSRVQGESMFPTLHENDYLIVNRMTYKFREPEMKDIIVFKSDIHMTVPKGKIFAMGDNRERSLDSRAQEVGLVDEDSVIGKVMVRLYPFNQIGGVK